jgi:hypothetical protein
MKQKKGIKRKFFWTCDVSAPTKFFFCLGLGFPTVTRCFVCFFFLSPKIVCGETKKSNCMHNNNNNLAVA